MSFAKELEKLGACREGVEWAGERTLEEIWRDCDRGDWLIWLAGELRVERKLLVLAACACARLVLPCVPAGEERPRVAIETMECWCCGEATIDEVKDAAEAAWAADAYAAARSAASAAWAAAWAAAPAAARAAAWSAADAAAWAAVYAADAAYAAYAAGHKATADAVRSVITFEMVEEAWNWRR